jgi:Nucleotidyltransferase/DNA polymerase involved in DNA repair
LHACRSTLEDPPVFLPVDAEFYEQISNKIMQTLRSYADAFEQVGIDEAYLDVTQKVNADFAAVKALVQKMKSDIKTRVGITFSVGVGPNKLVAKIAADRQKPDGLTIVPPEDVTGTELEFVIMVIAVSCVKLLSAHNSTQHTSRKHKV